MEHLRAFITAWLSICLVMLKCVWRRVSFHHTACFCVKCAVTVADLTTLHHSHCSLSDSLPSCSPSVAWDLTGRSSSPPPPRSSLFSSPISPVVVLLPLFYLPFPFLPCTSPSSPCLTLLSFLLPQCQLIRGVRKGQYKDLVWPTHWPRSTLFWAIISSH